MMGGQVHFHDWQVLAVILDLALRRFVDLVRRWVDVEDMSCNAARSVNKVMSPETHLLCKVLGIPWWIGRSWKRRCRRHHVISGYVARKPLWLII